MSNNIKTIEKRVYYCEKHNYIIKKIVLFIIIQNGGILH